MNYRLIADSSCELTDELISGLDAKSVPLRLTLGNKTYIDDQNLDVNEFLSDMKQYSGKTKSSCPAPFDFANECKENTVNFIITLSSQLSGSYSSACMAKDIAKEEGKEVYVFDSKSASAGETLIAIKIKEFIKNGFDVSQIVKNTENFISQMKTFFVLENLDNLVKNGRMNKITGTLATVMNIRPILGSDANGNIASYSKSRGSIQALEKLCGLIGKHATSTSDKTLVITHCNNNEGAKTFEKLVEKFYKFKDIIILPTRGLSSMYANEGGIIIAF